MSEQVALVLSFSGPHVIQKTDLTTKAEASKATPKGTSRSQTANLGNSHIPSRVELSVGLRYSLKCPRASTRGPLHQIRCIRLTFPSQKRGWITLAVAGSARCDASVRGFVCIRLNCLSGLCDLDPNPARRPTATRACHSDEGNFSVPSGCLVPQPRPFF